MFQGVRQGSVLYILKKGETPTLDAAHVVSVSNPYNPNAQNIFGQNPMVDIQVSIDGETVTFKELPALVSFTTSKDGVFVTDNTEDMLAEVKNLHRTSQQIVESAPHHEQLLPLYESFYDILDPNYKVAYEAFIAGYKEGYIKGSNDCNDTINQFYYLTAKI